MKYHRLTSQVLICLCLSFSIGGCNKDGNEDDFIVESPVIQVTSPVEDQEFTTGDEIPVRVKVTGNKLIQVKITLEAYSGILKLLSEVAELNEVSTYDYTGSCIVSGVISHGTTAFLYVQAQDAHGNLSLELVPINLLN